MQDDDFDGEVGIPDDELLGGSREADLGDLSGAGEAEAEGGEGQPSRRGSGGVRARSSTPRKAAVAKPAGAKPAARKKVAAKKKAAPKKKAARRGGAKKTARKTARKGSRKAAGGGRGKKAKRGRR